MATATAPATVPLACQPLSDQLDALQQSLDRLEDEMQNATGSLRTTLQHQINKLEVQVATQTAQVAACSAQPSAPVTASYREPEPGTVVVHMNGSVAAGFGIR